MIVMSSTVSFISVEQAAPTTQWFPMMVLPWTFATNMMKSELLAFLLAIQTSHIEPLFTSCFNDVVVSDSWSFYIWDSWVSGAIWIQPHLPSHNLQHPTSNTFSSPMMSGELFLYPHVRHPPVHSRQIPCPYLLKMMTFSSTILFFPIYTGPFSATIRHWGCNTVPETITLNQHVSENNHDSNLSQPAPTSTMALDTIQNETCQWHTDGYFAT